MSVNANRKYKDSVFVKYFRDAERLIELYNAIEDKHYPKRTKVKINTLETALFLKRINDLSFMIGGKLVILIEHQSTVSPNMPLRFLLYIARIYEKIVESKTIYRKTLVKIPKPDFIVLYNGKEDYPDYTELRLSDSFEESDIPDLLDLTVKVYNVNEGHNQEILKKSKSLHDYAAFIAKVRKGEEEGLPREEAIKTAIEYCIQHEIMKEFLKEHGSEVANMLFSEVTIEDVMDLRYEEGKVDDAINMLKEGFDLEIIARITDMDFKSTVRKTKY
jgi:hypothetical protein